MAASNVQVPPDSTGKKIYSFSNVIGADTVYAQAVVRVGTDGKPWEEGTWDKAAGVLTGPGSVTKTGRCHAIDIFANGVDSQVTINGGDTIMIRAGRSITYGPIPQLIDPVVTWVSGAVDVIVATVTPS